MKKYTQETENLGKTQRVFKQLDKSSDKILNDMEDYYKKCMNQVERYRGLLNNHEIENQEEIHLKSINSRKTNTIESVVKALIPSSKEAKNLEICLNEVHKNMKGNEENLQQIVQKLTQELKNILMFLRKAKQIVSEKDELKAVTKGHYKFKGELISIFRKAERNLKEPHKPGSSGQSSAFDHSCKYNYNYSSN